MSRRFHTCAAFFVGLVSLACGALFAQETPRATRPAGKPTSAPAATPVEESTKTVHATADGLLNGNDVWDLDLLLRVWKLTRVDSDKKTKVVRCFLTAEESLEARQRIAILRRSALIRVQLCDAEGEVVATTKLTWATSADAGVDIIKIDLNEVRDALDEAGVKPEAVRRVVIGDH